MIDLPAVFAEMERALAAHGFVRESELQSPESFGSRSRLYRRSAREALELTWDGRDGCLVLRGGVPWRDLAVCRDARTQGATPAAAVDALLREHADVRDFAPAI